jgi:gamma-glutamylcyclotransferase (GGCT)/AIG2-like uncharacterized protein YtfP
MSSPGHLIFVYGTLKRRGSNHAFLAGQEFVGPAATPAGWCLYELEGYPGMIAEPASVEGVTGELWRVDDACLSRLDALEGVNEGLYRRERIVLASPHRDQFVQTYVYARNVAGRRQIGATWPVD